MAPFETSGTSVAGLVGGLLGKCFVLVYSFGGIDKVSGRKDWQFFMDVDLESAIDVAVVLCITRGPIGIHFTIANMETIDDHAACAFVILVVLPLGLK